LWIEKCFTGSYEERSGMRGIGNRLIEGLCLLLFVAAILFGGADSESWAWFLWSKVVAVGLMGTAILIGNIRREE